MPYVLAMQFTFFSLPKSYETVIKIKPSYFFLCKRGEIQHQQNRDSDDASPRTSANILFLEMTSVHVPSARGRLSKEPKTTEGQCPLPTST